MAPQRLFGTHRAPHQFAAAVRAMSVQSRRHAVPAKVHSNEQINASGESGGRSLSQHSQFGRNSSINFSSGERLYQRRRAKARYVYIMPRSVRREFPCAVIAFSEVAFPGCIPGTRITLRHASSRFSKSDSRARPLQRHMVSDNLLRGKQPCSISASRSGSRAWTWVCPILKVSPLSKASPNIKPWMKPA